MKYENKFEKLERSKEIYFISVLIKKKFEERDNYRNSSSKSKRQ